jgi:Fe-S cluster biogenesis protein NfuA
MRTVHTHVQENGGAVSAVGVRVGIGVAILVAIGACGKASLDRLSHDR